MTDDNQPAAPEMPKTIYASPRGSGTVSGVWTDNKCGDEPETKYFREDAFVAGMKEYQRRMIALMRECADSRYYRAMNGGESLKVIAELLEVQSEL